MQFKKGMGWKACFDEETGRYTAECGGAGNYGLYESGRVWPEKLTDAAVELFASEKTNREQRRKKLEQRDKN